MKKGGISGKAHKAILFVLLTVAVGCGVYLFHYYADAQNSMKDMRQLSSKSAVSNISNEVSSGTASKISAAPEILPRFQSLRKENADIAGWVKIDGTNINYPVMFTPKDPEFYLHRNFKKKEENRGLPFFDAGTDLHTSANYLVYGHNMKDGTEFADLVKYRSKDYWKAHPTISFDTLYKTGKYQVLAAFNSKVYRQNDNVFKYYKFSGQATRAEYSSFVFNVKKLSLYQTGVTAEYGDRLLTLSTCSNYTLDGRFAVVAKKVS